MNRQDPLLRRLPYEVGIAFSLGLFGSGVFQVFRTLGTYPRGYRWKGLRRSWRYHSRNTAGGFATFTFLFVFSEFLLAGWKNAYLRSSYDSKTPVTDPAIIILSGGISGGIMAFRGGLRGVVRGTLLGGIFMAVMEGVIYVHERKSRMEEEIQKEEMRLIEQQRYQYEQLQAQRQMPNRASSTRFLFSSNEDEGPSQRDEYDEYDGDYDDEDDEE